MASLEHSTTPFTPDNELDLLFPPDIIPSDVKNALNTDLHVRLSSK